MCFPGEAAVCLEQPLKKKKTLLIHTFGLSVLGSLSTFSMAVRASNPPTTLQKQKKHSLFTYNDRMIRVREDKTRQQKTTYLHFLC